MATLRKDARGRKPAKETSIRRRTVVIVALALLAVAAATVALCVWRESPKHATLEYLQGKLSSRPVSATLQPVAILRYGDQDVIQTRGKWVVNCPLSGVGTLFKLPDGRERIVTAGHLFSDREDVNRARTKYMVRLLREKNMPVRGYVVSARSLLYNNPGLVDVAVCEVGQERGTDIQSFSPICGGRDTEIPGKFWPCSGDLEDRTVRSLVSGERATILFASKDLDGSGMCFLMIDYRNIRGESGTGFVDNRGNLFVLNASVSANTVAKINAALEKNGAMTGGRSHYAVITGPIVVSEIK